MSDQQEYAGVPSLTRYIDVPQRGFRLASHNVIRPSCMDDPRKMWRVRLNNWNRCEDFDRDGVKIHWDGMTYYVVFDGKRYSVRGLWATVVTKILAFILDGEKQSSSSQPRNKTSRYYGVGIDSKRRGWNAKIYVKRKPRYIGRFDSENEAAQAVNDYITANQLNIPLNTIVETSTPVYPGKKFSSKYKGVSMRQHQKRCSWQASIWVNGNMVNLKTWPTEEEAARAFNAYIIEHGLTDRELNVIDE